MKYMNRHVVFFTVLLFSLFSSSSRAGENTGYVIHNHTIVELADSMAIVWYKGENLLDDGTAHIDQFVMSILIGACSHGHIDSIIFKRACFDQKAAELIANLPALKELCLNNSSINNDILENIEGRKLERLSLWGTMVTDKAIDKIITFPNLKTLDIGNSAITGDSIHALEKLVALKRLGLGWMDIKDAELAVLRSLTDLEELDLSGTQVTDQGIKHILSLPKLKSIRINQTKISDKGVAELVKKKSFRCLCIWNSSIPESTIEKMAQDNSRLEIFHSEIGVTDGRHYGDGRRCQFLDAKSPLLNYGSNIPEMWNDLPWIKRKTTVAPVLNKLSPPNQNTKESHDGEGTRRGAIISIGRE